MKKLVQETCRLELVQPYCHRRNVAEVAIKNFKAHFISILAGVDDNFPIRQWDKLLPQAELTINLLRQANANPKLSAYSYLFRNFDYNRLPLAPLGCAVQVHVPPERQTSWGFRARKGWYIGCAWDHYRLHSYVDDGTSCSKVTGALDFKHKSRTNPTMNAYDKNMRAIQTLKAQLTGQQNVQGAEDIRQLQALTESITTAPDHNTLSNTELTSIKMELQHLKLIVHKLKNDFGPPVSPPIGTPATSPPIGTPAVAPPRVHSPTSAPTPRVPPTAIHQPPTAAVPRVHTTPAPPRHDGPAAHTRSRTPPPTAPMPTPTPRLGAAAGMRSRAPTLVTALSTAY